MSTIAYRNGVMAADSRAYAGFNKVIGSKRKIRRLGNGTLVGVSTNIVGASELIHDWYAAGALIKKKPELEEETFSLLAVNSDGRAYYAYNSFHLTGPLEADFFAIGSGDDAAMGAMAMGANAEQAVEIAARFDVWTDLPIIALKHEE